MWTISEGVYYNLYVSSLKAEAEDTGISFLASIRDRNTFRIIER